MYSSSIIQPRLKEINNKTLHKRSYLLLVVKVFFIFSFPIPSIGKINSSVEQCIAVQYFIPLIYILYVINY